MLYGSYVDQKWIELPNFEDVGQIWTQVFQQIWVENEQSMHVETILFLVF